MSLYFHIVSEIVFLLFYYRQFKLNFIHLLLSFQIAPAAKKLWGIESKDASSKLALNHLNHEGVWRDPTWAAPGKSHFFNNLLFNELMLYPHCRVIIFL